MKIIRVQRLIDAGGFSQTETWKTVEKHIRQAIEAIEWPPGSGSFTLYDQRGKARGEGSGVKPIKDACMVHLKSFGWTLETPVDIATLKSPAHGCHLSSRNAFCVNGRRKHIFKSSCN
jgi:hypothetical protein